MDLTKLSNQALMDLYDQAASQEYGYAPKGYSWGDGLSRAKLLAKVDRYFTNHCQFPTQGAGWALTADGPGLLDRMVEDWCTAHPNTWRWRQG